MEYIRRHYQVPAKRGALVEIRGGSNGDVCFTGQIVGSRGARLRVRVGARIGTYHPTDNIEYEEVQDGTQELDR